MFWSRDFNPGFSAFPRTEFEFFSTLIPSSEMESGVGSRTTEANDIKGLEGTGLYLPMNHHGNLKSAPSDQILKDLLLEIKSSKTPVRPK